MSSFFQSGIHWQLVNFFLFIGLLVFYLKKPVALFWKNRSLAIAAEIQEAERLRKEAGKRVFGLEERAAHLEPEMEKLIRSFREEGEMEKKEMIEEGKRYVEKLKHDAERVIAQELRKMKEELKQHVVHLSVDLAERLIRERFTLKDQEKLQHRFFQRLEEGV